MKKVKDITIGMIVNKLVYNMEEVLGITNDNLVTLSIGEKDLYKVVAKINNEASKSNKGIKKFIIENFPSTHDNIGSYYASTVERLIEFIETNIEPKGEELFEGMHGIRYDEIDTIYEDIVEPLNEKTHYEIKLIRIRERLLSIIFGLEKRYEALLLKDENAMTERGAIAMNKAYRSYIETFNRLSHEYEHDINIDFTDFK